MAQQSSSEWTGAAWNPVTGCTREGHELINLKRIAALVDAHRSTVRRWLSESGIEPVAIGRGRNGAIRYRWRDIREWLDSLQRVD